MDLPRLGEHAGRPADAAACRLDVEVEPVQAPTNEGSSGELMLQQWVIFEARFGADNRAIGSDRLRTLISTIGGKANLQQGFAAAGIINAVFAHNRSPKLRASFSQGGGRRDGGFSRTID
jgi:hypothetical protein